MEKQKTVLAAVANDRMNRTRCMHEQQDTPFYPFTDRCGRLSLAAKWKRLGNNRGVCDFSHPNEWIQNQWVDVVRWLPLGDNDRFLVQDAAAVL
jgi:hypothetical protein